MRDLFLQLACAGAGGFCGAIGRHAVGVGVKKLVPQFPAATMGINLLGCLVLGALMGATQELRTLTPELRTFLAVGILGSFTTFATFSADGVQLLRDRNYGGAAFYVLGSVAIGLLLFFVGYELLVRATQRG